MSEYNTHSPTRYSPLHGAHSPTRHGLLCGDAPEMCERAGASETVSDRVGSGVADAVVAQRQFPQCLVQMEKLAQSSGSRVTNVVVPQFQIRQHFVMLERLSQHERTGTAYLVRVQAEQLKPRVASQEVREAGRTAIADAVVPESHAHHVWVPFKDGLEIGVAEALSADIELGAVHRDVHRYMH